MRTRATVALLVAALAAIAVPAAGQQGEGEDQPGQAQKTEFGNRNHQRTQGRHYTGVGQGEGDPHRQHHRLHDQFDGGE